ncbi:MAG: sulfotransferase, partial [Acidimicrobiia bacterium]|nr:sulfotransferase [Acidimicrobiia bacterium]
MSTEHPALFVVGCGRSGTTLLRSMLDAHPELAIPGESHFLRRMLRLRRRYEHGSQFDLERYVADLSRDVRFRRWVADPEPLIERIRAGRPLSLADAVRATFGAYARSQDKIRWGDKTPDYVTMMPAISELLPEARFVHLIRDGRAVAASLAHQSWGPSRIDTAAL